MFGRVRPIPDINSKNTNQRGFAERTAVNTPLQGTAADLIKIAMIRIDKVLRERGLKSRMTLQVHDELVFEVPEKEVETMRALVREQMENVHPLTGPVAGRSRSGTELAGLGVGSGARQRPCGDGSQTRPGRAPARQAFSFSACEILAAKITNFLSVNLGMNPKKPSFARPGRSETRPYKVSADPGALRPQRVLDRPRDILRQ